MIIKTKGLIIKEQSVGESDRIVTILTQNDGVIRAFARKAKKITDSKLSSTSLLAYSDFSIYKGKDKYIIDRAKPIEIFFSLRNDIVSLSLAQYFCQLAAIFVPEDTQSEEYLRLVLNSIKLLETKDKLLIKAITEFRIASLSGFMPNLIACKLCHCYESEHWLFENSELTCLNCLKSDNNINFNNNIIAMNIISAIRHTVYSDFDKIYSFNMSEKSIKIFSEQAEAYVLGILRHKPTALSFYKSIVS